MSDKNQYSGYNKMNVETFLNIMILPFWWKTKETLFTNAVEIRSRQTKVHLPD